MAWEEPPGSGRLEQERQYGDAERRRLVYVAATRARDMLVIPKPNWEQDPNGYIHARLLADPDPSCVLAVEPFIEGSGASWSSQRAPLGPITDTLDIELLAKWAEACAQAKLPKHAPRSVTGVAKAVPVLRVGDTDLETKQPRPKRLSRFGPVFGDAVHEAIGLVLTRGWSASRAVEVAATMVGLAVHLDDAVADVDRAVEALRAAQLVGEQCTIRLEYPIAAARDGLVLTGYLDLVSATGDELAVIDFKTDQPSGDDVLATHPEYVTQVRTYAGIIGAHRSGLLFTATGQIAWVDS